MNRNLLASGLTLITIALCALPARAASGQPCGPRPELLERLGVQYGESRQSMGLAENGFVVETYAGDNGNWTILVTRPNGISCMMASGGWFEAAEQVRPVGDPA